MAALVQSFPSPSASTMTMLQARSSSSEAFPTQPQSQQSQRNSQTPRNIYNTSVGGMAAGSYRGQTSASPISPYAFTSTPSFQTGQNPLRQHPTMPPNPRLDNRTSSSPALSPQQMQNLGMTSRPRPPILTGGSPPMGSSFSNHQHASHSQPKDASPRPLSAIDLNTPALSYASVAKSSPDRYRRNHQRVQTSGNLSTGSSMQGGSAVPSGSGMATVGHLYNHPSQSSSSPALSSYASYRGSTLPSQPLREQDLSGTPRLASKDDMNLHRQSSSELAKRYRRRSIGSLEAKDFGLPPSETVSSSTQPKTYAAMLASPAPSERKESPPARSLERPSSAHGRNASAESSVSGRSNPTSSSVSASSH